MNSGSKGGRGKEFLVTLISLGFLAGASQSFAAMKFKFDEEKTIVKEIKLKGDFRFRHENIDNSGGTVDRQRQRLRFRMGVDFKLLHHLEVKTRVASGEDSQTSTNQTLTDNSDPKGIFIDRVYINWKPIDLLSFNAGKMANPFWRVTTSDLMWDADYNPEGLSEGIEGWVGSVKLFVNLGQFSIQERINDTQDAYLFTEQGGIEFKLPVESRFTGAMAYHDFSNIAQGGIGGVNTLATNTPGASFSIFEITGALKTWISKIPLSIETTWLNNRAAPKTTVGGALAVPEKQDTAFQAGVIVGKANKKNNWEAAYFYKEIEQDAAVSGITDSDFPNTTNAKGHIAWVAYSLTDWIRVQIKHYNAKNKVVAAGAADGATQKTQFDLSFEW